MDLRQLRYALAVVDEGTFTAAAAACFVAQPSLSQAVAALERELGATLFDRHGRRVIVTAAGEAFVPAARAALRAVETVRADVDAVSGLVAGHLDLVALPTLAVDPVTPLVGAFRRAHPGVVVRLAHPDDSDELLDRVRSGSSELGITELPVSGDRLVSRPLHRQELVAVLPPGSSALRKMRPRELATRPLVTMPVGTSTRDALDAAVAGTGVRIEAAVETDQREAIGPLVLAGAGAAVLPRPMASVIGAQGGVVVPLDPPIWRDIGIVHRDAPLSPAARAFLDLSVDGSGRGATREITGAGTRGRSRSSGRPRRSGG